MTLPGNLESMRIRHGAATQANIVQLSGRTAWGPDTEETNGDDYEVCDRTEDQKLPTASAIVSPSNDPTLEGFQHQILGIFPRLEPALTHRFASAQLRRYNILVNFQKIHLDAVINRSCSSGEYCSERGGRVSAMQVPTHPAGFLQEPVSPFPCRFECPICFQVKEFKKLIDWSKHVQEDLQPFTCTFPDCLEPKSFKRKADWMRHEKERHRELEWWVCSYADCNQEYFHKENFIQHLVRQHNMPEPKAKKTINSEAQRELDIDRLWEMVEQCRQESKQTSQQESCRFCGNIYDNWKMLMAHMGKHLEHLARLVPDLVKQYGASDGSRLCSTGAAGGRNRD